MNNIAFIFARGGSKGVPGKNIKDLAGRPLIAYSIDTALKSKYISKVVVSTDDAKIAEVSKGCGAEVLDRPGELATDESSEVLSWKHAIQSLNLEDKDSLFISLPATSPLRNSTDVDNAIEKFNGNNFDIIFGISESHRNPYLNMVRINERDEVEIAISGLAATRRQDVPKIFNVTTCVYVARPEYIKKCQSIMEGSVGYVEIPVERSLDIDNFYDFYLAELLIRHPYHE